MITHPSADKEKPKLRQWYAIQTYAGYEEAVERYLKQRVESLAMTDKIFNVVMPKEKKIRVEGGKRQTTVHPITYHFQKTRAPGLSNGRPIVRCVSV